MWIFYTESKTRMFPPRRRAKVDLGDSKFGVSPDEPEFVGRRVDLIGRSVPGARPGDVVGTLRRYLSEGKTQSARLLSLKAMILIEPAEKLGTVVWPLQ